MRVCVRGKDRGCECTCACASGRRIGVVSVHERTCASREKDRGCENTCACAPGRRTGIASVHVRVRQGEGQGL